MALEAVRSLPAARPLVRATPHPPPALARVGAGAGAPIRFRPQLALTEPLGVLPPRVRRASSSSSSPSQIKDRVYKQRIRIQDFFADFDKLRCGGVTAAQFASALSMAGFNLAAGEYAELASAYPCDVPDKPVAWKAFCADVNLVFSKANLEKNPLEEVALEPENILDPTRFSVRPNAGALGGGGDEALDALLERTAEEVRKKRVDVLPFFRDACSNQNSPMKVNHVTPKQFAQVLKSHVARDATEAEMEMLCEAFGNGEMVNFAAFAAVVDPKEPVYHAYRRTPTYL